MPRSSELIVPKYNLTPVLLTLAGVSGLVCIGLGARLVGMSTAITPHKYEATMQIATDGFVPKVLEVKPGTLVTFENLTPSTHKIDASIAEPDAIFGSVAPIQPQGAYVFTFDKAGSYKFHDADNVLDNGEVIVQ